MNKTKIIYWVATVLFAAFMAFTSVPSLMNSPDAVKFMAHLGYPAYFVTFISIAKLLGCIAILVPAFPLIKEWAYAGLFFDIIGAGYSLISVDGFNSSMVFLLLPLGLGVVSYLYSHKVYPIVKAN